MGKFQKSVKDILKEVLEILAVKVPYICNNELYINIVRLNLSKNNRNGINFKFYLISDI